MNNVKNQQANDAGIPPVLVNDTIDDEACEAQGAHYETYIGTDNYQGGTIGGQFVAEQDPDIANPLEYAIKAHNYLAEYIVL
ncbi:MAG: hypothetical protein IJG17_08945 [Eubacterium sp.]|nr:hypothetical protein [Eubacterium sp.]